MYKKGYGIIETQAPLHVGASAGEEAGNLNLIFRDQFTQTGIIPGSSLRGRFRADMRDADREDGDTNFTFTRLFYGHEAITNQPEQTTESLIKFEYASPIWLPVFCPGQPIVFVTCPRWLNRYQQITGQTELPKVHPHQVCLSPPRQTLFFNLGFLRNLTQNNSLSDWVPQNTLISKPKSLVVVSDGEISAIHDMGLYRQSRVKLKDDDKIVDGKAFFNVEALPEGTILIFPIAIKSKDVQEWKEGLQNSKWEVKESNFSKELYLGGLESIGFGRCQVTINFTGV
jgi:CRISPR-associated protein Cmr4